MWPFGPGSCLDVNLLHQFGQDLFEPPVADERSSGDLEKPPFDMGPLICVARVGVVFGEIAGVTGLRRSLRLAPFYPASARRIMFASCDFRYG